MSFKAKVPVPAGVEILRRYDRREIDGQTSKLGLFLPGSPQNDEDRNYANMPLQGAKNHVVLGISISPLMTTIETEANVDPVKVVNNLNDAVLKIETNGGREERITHPLKDYMNFSQTRAAVASSYDTNSVVNNSIVQLQATGPRNIDNLFYFEPNESFTVNVLFKTGDFPAQSDFSKGRFGLEVELYLAQMNNQQLKRYDQRLKQAAG
jgi:hypothetical protein